jgi:EAL domain-containing protein (putative c-di-GMP-specific phosphodiesterase class I)
MNNKKRGRKGDQINGLEEIPFSEQIVYVSPPLPSFELPRLKELKDLDLLKIKKDERLDRYTALVADIFDVPVALITLVDKDFQWFKSCYGTPLEGTPRNIALCSYTILLDDTLIIEDTSKDVRLTNHPLVINEPYVRFYAGCLLRGPNNLAFGTLCLIDFQPKSFKEKQKERLSVVAKMVEDEILHHYYLKSLNNSVITSAYYDAETDLPNRRLFKERISNAINNKSENQDYFVLCLGIKDFENIKHSFGQAKINIILKEVSSRLKRIIMAEWILGKAEDDKFLIGVILERSDDVNKILEPVAAIIKAIFNESFLQSDDFSGALTGRIGISIYGKDCREVDDLIEKSMVGMKNYNPSFQSFQLYSTCLAHQISQDFRLQCRLSEAIKNSTIQMVFQPIIDIQSGKICGAEALCRWTDSKLGVIPPSDFISIAEKTGLIVSLGTLVFKKACSQFDQLSEQIKKNLTLSINVASEQLLQDNFVDVIAKITQEIGISPHTITLEITESSLINNMDKAIKNIKEAHKHGFNFSLDDFGTGFSSLTYLQRFPIKSLKIDKSFINNMTFDTNDASLVQGIIALAKSLNLVVVAEGVETQEQLLFLKAYQCHKAQGYFIGKPLPLEGFVKGIEAEGS